MGEVKTLMLVRAGKIRLLLLPLLVLLSVPAQSSRISAPARDFVTARAIRQEGERNFSLEQGVFHLAPLVIFEQKEKGATVKEVGGTFIPRHAGQKIVTESKWFGRKDYRLVEVGKTRIELLGIEALEKGRTLALFRPGVSERLSPAERTYSFPRRFRVTNRKDFEIRYHLRIAAEGSALAGGGLRTIVWHPEEFTLTLNDAIPEGVPPRPASFRIIGDALLFNPPSPFAGDSFSAHAIVMNAGDEASDTAAFIWEYADRLEPLLFAPLEPSATRRVSFDARAEAVPLNLILRMGDTSTTTALVPRTRPLLKLLGLDVTPNFAEEPLVVIAAIANEGTGAAVKPRLRIEVPGDSLETGLPAIPPGERFAQAVTWSGKFPDSFLLEVELIDGDRVVAARSFPVSRPRRPRSRFVLERLGFSGSREAGAWP